MMSPAKAERLVRRAYRIHRDGQITEALGLYGQVLRHYPTAAVPLHYAALATRQLNEIAKSRGLPTRDDEAMRLMAASVMAAPENAGAVHNFGKFKHDRGELEDARDLYTVAVTLDEEQGESWTNLGNVYGELGNRLRAEACWNRALTCARPTPEARFNLSFLRLLRGDYATGWAEYESRWESVTFRSSYGRPDLTAPKWDGGECAGTLFLHGEQGAGDILMMARYIPGARARVGALVLEVLPGLVPLFRAAFPDLTVVARGDEVPAHDAQAPMMSLPLLMGTDSVEKVPDPVGFLPIQPESGRIGVCWKGSPTHVNDRTRSMPFEALRPLFEIPGFTWQSLQYGEATEAPLVPLTAGDYLETAREIARCSLVITVDTSIAHLAASMGVPTWILLPYVAEWRWMLDRDDSPWYPSARLWRQPAAGDWHDLIEAVAVELTSTPPR